MSITSTENSLREKQNILNHHLRQEGILVDNERVLPVSLSPYQISYERYMNLSNLCKLVMSAIEKFLRLYVENKEIQDLFPELEHYRALSCIKPKYHHWVHLARFDLIETEDSGFKLLETNCDCPGAILFAPFVKKILKKLNLNHIDNTQEYYEQPLDDEFLFIKSLIKSYSGINSDKNFPNIAFLSSTYHKITSDLNLLEKVGKKIGVNCKHVSIQDLKCINGQLCFNHTPINLAYQKFDAFIDENHQAKPCIYDLSPTEVEYYWEALHKGKLVTYNSFPSSLVAENKRILSYLRQPEFQQYFTDQENSAIDELVPQTYTFFEKFKDKKIIEEFMANKNKYVIKKTIDTRGRGVWIGENCNKIEWENLVQKYLHEPYIIQEFIKHKKSSVYDASDNPVLTQMYNTLAMFIIAGEPVGLIARASKDVVTNVGKSGCIRPVYVKN